jgi:hypothetical protein
MEARLFLMRWIKSTKKDVRKGAFCSLDKISNLDLIDSIPPSTEEEGKDLLSFSISKKFHSILITKPFLMEFALMQKFKVIINRIY